ncbi:MAG: Vgb family protein [Solirubrobacterales bacterium]
MSLYKLPRVPPTGGTEVLGVDPLGQVWFGETFEERWEGGEASFTGRVVHMNRAGEISVATRDRPGGFAFAPDGSVWYSASRWIVQIAPNGKVSEFFLPEGGGGKPTTFAAGPIVIGGDGNVWFSGSRSTRSEEGSPPISEAIIGRLTPAGDLSEFPLPGQGGFPTKLAAGPDGNVWFTELNDRVGLITPMGQIAEFSLPQGSRPGDIVTGPDGALWFMEEGEDIAEIGRMTTSGQLTQFPVGKAFSATLASGPDGRLWFVSEGEIGRISPSGRISRVVLPQSTSPEDLAVGPEGSVWYTSPAEPPCLPGDSVCGDGGYYQSGIIGRIDPAPLSVQIGRAKAAAHAHRLKLRLTCIDGHADSLCQGQLHLRAAGTDTTRRYKLGTDLSRVFSVRLSKKARTKLLSRGRLHVKATATLGGGRRSVRSLWLRLPA